MASDETVKRAWPNLTPWKPGVSANPAGRPIGARVKLTEKYMVALAADFEKHGARVIREVRETDPSTYLRVIASLVPKQLEVDTSPLGAITDEQILSLVGAIDAWLAANPDDNAEPAVLSALPEAKAVPRGGNGVH
jgi:hypothetical protein